jgi:hypothetical protein
MLVRIWFRAEHEPTYRLSHSARNRRECHVFNQHHLLPGIVAIAVSILGVSGNRRISIDYASLLPLASSIVGVVLAVAVALGPVLGGAISSSTTW